MHYELPYILYTHTKIQSNDKEEYKWTPTHGAVRKKLKTHFMNRNINQWASKPSTGYLIQKHSPSINALIKKIWSHPCSTDIRFLLQILNQTLDINHSPSPLAGCAGCGDPNPPSSAHYILDCPAVADLWNVCDTTLKDVLGGHTMNTNALQLEIHNQLIKCLNTNNPPKLPNSPHRFLIQAPSHHQPTIAPLTITQDTLQHLLRSHCLSRHTKAHNQSLSKHRPPAPKPALHTPPTKGHNYGATYVEHPFAPLTVRYIPLIETSADKTPTIITTNQLPTNTPITPYAGILSYQHNVPNSNEHHNIINLWKTTTTQELLQLKGTDTPLVGHGLASLCRTSLTSHKQPNATLIINPRKRCDTTDPPAWVQSTRQINAGEEIIIQSPPEIKTLPNTTQPRHASSQDTFDLSNTTAPFTDILSSLIHEHRQHTSQHLTIPSLQAIINKHFHILNVSHHDYLLQDKSSDTIPHTPSWPSSMHLHTFIGAELSSIGNYLHNNITLLPASPHSLSIMQEIYSTTHLSTHPTRIVGLHQPRVGETLQLENTPNIRHLATIHTGTTPILSTSWSNQQLNTHNSTKNTKLELLILELNDCPPIDWEGFSMKMTTLLTQHAGQMITHTEPINVSSTAPLSHTRTSLLNPDLAPFTWYRSDNPGTVQPTSNPTTSQTRKKRKRSDTTIICANTDKLKTSQNLLDAIGLTTCSHKTKLGDHGFPLHTLTPTIILKTTKITQNTALEAYRRQEHWRSKRRKI